MNLFTLTPEREVIASVQFLPAVSITIPFTPLFTLRKNLDYSLKSVLGKVEYMLSNSYSAEKAIPIIVRLQNIFGRLNYYTHKKSIAIFVSPVVEKVYYLEVELEENIVTDPNFTISDLVQFKKEKSEYLILQLNENWSRMYLGNNKELKLIKSNMAAVEPEAGNISVGMTEGRSPGKNSKELQMHRFLVQMDQGLSIILKSYPLPVFVTGPEKVLHCFELLTKNAENLVQFTACHADNHSVAGPGHKVKLFASSRKRLKQLHLIKKIEKAGTLNKLSTGIQETLQASRHNRGGLLVVGSNFANHEPSAANIPAFYKKGRGLNEDFFIQNEVDEIIKNIFERGGDVEFIEDRFLEQYGHIALIENY